MNMKKHKNLCPVQASPSLIHHISGKLNTITYLGHNNKTYTEKISRYNVDKLHNSP